MQGFESAGLENPCGVGAREPLKAAPRLASLDGRRLVAVSNSKMGSEYGPYAVIWDALARQLPGVTWGSLRLDVHGFTEAQAEKLADQVVREQRPDAAILALADSGVSLATSSFALMLERRGIPTLVISTEVGARFVRPFFAAWTSGLETVAIDTMRTDSAPRVASLIEEQIEAIRSGLLSAGSERAAASSPVSSPPASKAGNWNDVAEDVHAFQDWAESAGLGDGLPLIPPTRSAVERLLQHVGDDPEAVIFGPAMTSGRMLRVRDAAANAAMTGCPPRSFPVVVAALRAMALPGYRLNWAAITTHGAGNAVVFSGPDPAAFGLSGGAGSLGPGYRGNAAVGRAVSLTVLSIFGARPGEMDFTAIGSPAEFAYCTAEAVDRSPWPSLADEMGNGKAGVLVVKAEAPRNVLEHIALTPEGVSRAFAETALGLGSNNSYYPSDLLIFMNPEHARIFGDAGWTRADVASSVYELARMSRSRIAQHGTRPMRPAYMAALDELPVVRSPKDVHIVVCGADSPASAVALPWGLSLGQWHPIDSNAP